MTTTPRIFYVINSMEGGGAASPIPDILAALERVGAEVQVAALTRRNGKSIARIEAAGYSVLVRPGGERDHLRALKWIVDRAREFGATHLWTSLTRATLLGQIAGARLGIPVISWQHNAFLKPWNRRLLRWNAHRSVLWVADSAEVAALTRERLRVPEDRLVTWPIFFADPSAALALPRKDGEPLRIGSLGRLHPAKGYDVLIDALAMLRSEGFVPPCPVSVEICGEGTMLAALENRRVAAGLDYLHFNGFVPNPGQFLSTLHLYLQPSRREGFCIAAHEAKACGLPVLVSATGEMPRTVLDGSTGRIVAVGDVPALAQALRDLLSNPEALTQMGRAARARVLDLFSKERFEAVGAQIVDRLRTLSPE